MVTLFGPSQQVVERSLEEPEWRNGRRAGFKILCPKGRVGSTPTSGIRSSLREVFRDTVGLISRNCKGLKSTSLGN